MKIRFLDNDIGLHSFKCGAEIAAAAAVTGGLGLVNGLASNASSQSNVNAQLRQQSEENQKNRDFQTLEAEKARAFISSQQLSQQQYQTSERQAAQQFSSEEATRMAELNAFYNSPVYQSSELRKAGLNPQVYFGGSSSSFSGSNMSAPSSSGGPAPSGSSSPLPSGTGGLSPVGYQPLDLQLGNLASGIGAMMSGLGSAKKAGVETDYLEKTMQQRIENLGLEGQAKSLAIEGLKLDNNLKTIKLSYAEKREIEELYNLSADSILKSSQGESAHAQKELFEAQAKVQKMLEGKTDLESKLLALEIQNYNTKLNAYLSSIKSQNAANYASAQNQTAQANTENALRDLRAFGLSYENDLKQDSHLFNVQTFDSRVEEIKNKIGSQQLQTALLEIEKRDKDAYTTLQRIFFGKHDTRDIRKAVEIMRNLDSTVFY